MSRVDPTADVARDADIDPSVAVWQFAHIREGARVGAESVIGRGVYVGPGVVVGSRCKVQNYALLYEPARLGSGVFVGPAVVLTNDRHPRAVNLDGSPKAAADWDPVGVTVLDGASIGAHATCVAPVTVGRWAMVAAGSVVITDVPDYGLVAGVPARRIGWVGPAGYPLEAVEGQPASWRCPATGALFDQQADDTLVPS